MKKHTGSTLIGKESNPLLIQEQKRRDLDR